jgi:hypothetical protein
VRLTAATGFDPSTLPTAAACALPSTLVGGDGRLYSWTDLERGVLVLPGPSGINVATGPTAWVEGQTQSLPTLTLTVANAHPCRLLRVVVWNYTGGLARLLLTGPAKSTLALTNLFEVDPGTGAFVPLTAAPGHLFGNAQLTLTHVNLDTGAVGAAGQQSENLTAYTDVVPPATNHTYGLRGTLTIDDGGFGQAWIYATLSAMAWQL